MAGCDCSMAFRDYLQADQGDKHLLAGQWCHLRQASSLPVLPVDPLQVRLEYRHLSSRLISLHYI